MVNHPRLGPYELIKRIGYGGMAEIYLARTSGIGGFEKLLALKLIHSKYAQDQEFIDMLIDEAKIAVQLSHVNVCQIFDLGCVGDRFFIAMEFVDGQDLYQMLVEGSEKDTLMPFDLVAFIGREVAAGLEYAHTKQDQYGRPLNLIHRDISPQNVLVSFDGQVKLVDFGIAKASQRRQETESGVIKGKFYYMSPEQAWGDPLDPRSDVFSCGICLYEMLCGQMLYNEDDPLALLDKVRRAEIPPISETRSGVPAELERIILKALARDRDQRYADAGQLKSDLSSFLYGRWPDFQRHRLGEYAQSLAGTKGFVMELPSDEPPTTRTDLDDEDTIMRLDEYDHTQGQSVIFALGDIPKVLDTSDDGVEQIPPHKRSSPTLNEVAPDTDYTSDSGFDNWTELGEKTELLDVSLFETSTDLPATGEIEAADDEREDTKLFSAVSGPLVDPLVPSKIEPLPDSNTTIDTSEFIEPKVSNSKPLGTTGSTHESITKTNSNTHPDRVRPSQPSTVANLEPKAARGRGSNSLPDLRFNKQLKRHSKLSSWMRKLLSPKGISVVFILVLLGYGLYRFLPGIGYSSSTHATLKINSFPDGARVYLDGVDRQLRTETTVSDLQAGRRYELRLELPGYVPHIENIDMDGTIGSDGKILITKQVFMTKSLGRLSVFSDPPGAEIYINGVLKGETPKIFRRLDREKDRVYVVLKKDGFSDAKSVNHWGDETELKLNLKLHPKR
ncbi:MAG: serine/threonine-protein kinase [Myxococcota bacterium]|nr:serine/threonine-protein kinase [Myxococcota bacterium]